METLCLPENHGCLGAVEEFLLRKVESKAYSRALLSAGPIIDTHKRNGWRNGQV